MLYVGDLLISHSPTADVMGFTLGRRMFVRGTLEYDSAAASIQGIPHEK